MGTRFILTGVSRNVINNYEITSLLDDLCRTYPVFATYIQSNVRNYVIKRFPCVRLLEDEGHKIYQEFYKQDKYSLNPEVLISKSKNPDGELHQILISISLLTQIRHAMEYLLVHNVQPKANMNVNDLCRKADEWNKKLIKEQDSLEGRIEVVQENQGKTWVLLKDFQAFRREAALMRNCVKSYYASHQNDSCKIYSLRDEQNMPLVTMEVKDNQILQIKEFANSPAKKYEKEIYYFMLTFKMQKRMHMSEFEMNNMHPYIGMLPYNNDFDDIEFSHGYSIRMLKSLAKLVIKPIKAAWFYLEFLVYILKSK